MSLKYRGRAKLCPLLLALGIGVGSSVAFSSEPTAVEVNWQEDWEQRGFTLVDFDVETDQELETILDLFASDTPMYNNDWDWVLHYQTNGSKNNDELWNLKDCPKLTYGFEQTDGNPILMISSFEIVRALDLHVISRYETIDNGVGFTLFTDKIKEPESKIIFKENVALTYYAAGPDHSAVWVTGGGKVDVIFEKKLSVQGDFLSGGVLLNISEEEFKDLEVSASVMLNGETTLRFGTNHSSNIGIYLADNGSLLVNNTLQVIADDGKSLSGRGSITVNFSEPSKSDRYVLLNGSTEEFSGKYTQTGGYLLVSDAMSRSATWSLDGVNLITQSGNFFEVAADEWVPHELRKLNPVVQSGLNSLTLTDESVRLDYLIKASNALNDQTLIFYTGEITVAEGVLSEITFDKDYGVLGRDNLILSHVTLAVNGSDDLKDKTVTIGNIRNVSEGSLELKNSQITLYGNAADSVLKGMEKLVVDEQSTLLLHGLRPKDLAKSWPGNTYTDVPITVKAGGALVISGLFDTTADGDITNESGNVRFASDSLINLSASYKQEGGSTTIDELSKVTFSQAEFSGGDLVIEGLVKGKVVDVANISAVIQEEGSLDVRKLSIKEFGELKIQDSSWVAVDDLYLNNASIQIDSTGSSEDKAMLIFENATLENSRISVNNQGSLVAASTEEAALHQPNLASVYKFFNATDKSGFVVQRPVQLSETSRITIGEANGNSESQVIIGSDGVLVLNALMEKPAFSATTGQKAKIEFLSGSGILLLEPYQFGYLTDDSVELIGDLDSLEIKATNSWIQVALVQDDNGWKFERIVDAEVMPDFIYPTLQGEIYSSNLLSTDSVDLGIQFFSRVDDSRYMDSIYSRQLTAEATQLANLLGLRLTVYSSVASLGEQMREATRSIIESPSGTYKLYSGISSGAVFSKVLGGYLGEARYRAFDKTATIGLAYSFEGGLVGTVAASFSDVDVKSRGTVSRKAKNDQQNFAVSAEVEKQLGDWKIGAGALYAFSSNKIQLDLPQAMEMASWQSKPTGNLIGVRGGIAWDWSEDLEIGIRPTLWYFSALKEKVKSGSELVYTAKSSGQTFAEIPLYADYTKQFGFKNGFKLDLNAAVSSALRVGQLKNKTTLTLPSVNASEQFKQKNFSRWNSQLNLGLKLTKGNFDTKLNAAMASGDSRVDARAGVSVQWRF